VEPTRGREDCIAASAYTASFSRTWANATDASCLRMSRQAARELRGSSLRGGRIELGYGRGEVVDDIEDLDQVHRLKDLDDVRT
jgi:hypothetical protein